MELLYKWANDPKTRANSFNSDLIPFQSHKKWFMEKIDSPDVLFFIYCCEGLNIGQLRFDIKGETVIINYSIDLSFRGKGYGYRMITLGEKMIQDRYPEIKWIQAVVKCENDASLNIFRKLNFGECRESSAIKFVKRIPPPPPRSHRDTTN
jgi:RimJ/RimL family protein N-acetyltransferase